MTVDEPLTPDLVVQQLNDRRSDALATLEMLAGYRLQIDEQRAAFENPQLVSDYVAFFQGFVGRAVVECERIAAELPAGPKPAHVAVLRELVATSTAEQRRCLQFRDKCINRPLPHERLRPLLNEISITTRDQLTAFRDFTRAADRIEQLLAVNPPPPDPPRVLDRRSLFTRLLKREQGG